MGTEVDRIATDVDGISLYINRKTGELINPEESGVIFYPREIDAIKAKTAEPHYDINELYKDYGHFTWLIFRYCDRLLPDIGGADLTKLLYLSTYISYDGIICSGKHKADRDTVQELLGIGRKACGLFLNKMIGEGVFVRDGEYYRINGDVLFRGKLPKRRGGDYIRLNHDHIRQLYLATPAKEHASLSYFFRLIPYINKEHNVVCANPTETDGEHVIPMELSRCLKIACGDAFDGDHSARIAQKALAARYCGKYIMRCLVDVFHPGDNWIIVNPYLYYAGSNIDSNSSEFKVFFNSQL